MSDFSTLQAAVGNLKDDVSQMRDSIANAINAIGNLKSATAALRATIEELKKQIGGSAGDQAIIDQLASDAGAVDSALDDLKAKLDVAADQGGSTGGTV